MNQGEQVKEYEKKRRANPERKANIKMFHQGEKRKRQAGAELCQAQPQAVHTGCPLANDQNYVI